MAESYVLLVNFVLQNNILLPKHTILPPGGCFGAIAQKLKQIPPPLGVLELIMPPNTCLLNQRLGTFRTFKKVEFLEFLSSQYVMNNFFDQSKGNVTRHRILRFVEVLEFQGSENYEMMLVSYFGQNFQNIHSQIRIMKIFWVTLEFLEFPEF